MLNYQKGICKGCNEEKYIQNKTLTLCKDCVYKRNHGGKTFQEVQQEKEKGKIRIPTKIKNRKVKVTGEREMFLEIWAERPHYCTNPECLTYLGSEPKASFFAHKKSKSTHPELRLDKTNIRLLCFDCHFAMDHQGREIKDE